MLIRYRTNSSCTIENFKADVNNIILGNIASVNDLSSGADKVNSVMYGTYPVGTYARVNASTFTYSKAHNSINGYTHYIRMAYDSTKMTTLALAQSYTSGTDTLVNSYTQTVNIQTSPYSVFKKFGIDIIVSSKMLVFFAPASGQFIGMLDLGHSTTTRTFTNSMLTMMQDFNNVPNYGVNSGNPLLANTGGTIPYMYNYDIAAYSSVVTGIGGAQTSKKPAGPGASVIFENPSFTNSSGAVNLMQGCYRIPFVSFSGVQVYKDSSNLYRLTINDISLLVD